MSKKSLSPANAKVRTWVLVLSSTYLTLQSLVARLGFSALLLLLANVVSAGELLTWAMLSTVLRIALALGAISLIVLWISGRRIRIN